MEPKSSLPCLQEPATCPYPDPDQSNHHILLFYIFFPTQFLS